MGELKIVEVYGYSEWAAGTYRADDGEEYQLTIERHCNKDLGHEYSEVVNIEKAGINVSEDDPIWKEVSAAV